MGRLERRLLRDILLKDRNFKKTMKETRKALNEPVSVWYILRGLQQYATKIEQAKGKEESSSSS